MSANSASLGWTSGALPCGTICTFIRTPDALPRFDTLAADGALLTGPKSLARSSTATFVACCSRIHLFVSRREELRRHPPSDRSLRATLLLYRVTKAFCLSRRRLTRRCYVAHLSFPQEASSDLGNLGTFACRSEHFLRNLEII